MDCYIVNKKLIRRWDSEHKLSLQRHCTRTKNTIDSCINCATDRFLQGTFTKFTPTEGFPWGDLRKIFIQRSRMAKVPHGIEILPKISTAWVGCTNVTERQTDDRRTDGRWHVRQKWNPKTTHTKKSLFQDSVGSACFWNMSMLSRICYMSTTHTASHRFAENSKCITWSSSSDFCSR